MTCVWQTTPRAPPWLQRANFSPKPWGAVCAAFGVTDTPIPLLPAPARSQRVFLGAVTMLVASQQVSLCNSALVGLFLCLQAHSSPAEGAGNLSRTGLENKPSIPL